MIAKAALAIACVWLVIHYARIELVAMVKRWRSWRKQTDFVEIGLFVVIVICVYTMGR